MNPLIAPEAGRHEARCALSVNVNKVALLRNTRHLGIPSVTRAAHASASSITSSEVGMTAPCGWGVGCARAGWRRAPPLPAMRIGAPCGYRRRKEARVRAL